MSNFFERQILLGSRKSQVSTDSDITLNLPLEGTEKELDEFDRSSVISLAQVFDDERQESHRSWILGKWQTQKKCFQLIDYFDSINYFE